MHQIVFFIFGAFQLALIALIASGYGVRVHTTVANASVAFVTTVVLAVLSDFEHCKAVRPSAIIQTFFFFTIILDTPRLRTQWLLDNNNIIATLISVVFAWRLVLIFVESLQKWNYSSIPPESIAPEDRQGVFGRTFFTWLNPMFMEGYKRDLTMDDLFQIDDDLKGQKLHARLLKQWKAGEIYSQLLRK